MCWRGRLFMLIYLILLSVPVLQFCGVLFIVLGYSKQIKTGQNQGNSTKSSVQLVYLEGLHGGNIESCSQCIICFHKMPQGINDNLQNCLACNNPVVVRNSWTKYHGFKLGIQTSRDHVINMEDTWRLPLELILQNKTKTSLYWSWNQPDAQIVSFKPYSKPNWCNGDLSGSPKLNNNLFSCGGNFISLNEGKELPVNLKKTGREKFTSSWDLLKYNLTKCVDIEPGTRKGNKMTNLLFLAPYHVFSHLKDDSTRDLEHKHNYNGSIFGFFAENLDVKRLLIR